MKSLYESILDDEDVLIDNAKQDIKKLDNPIVYFIHTYINELENDKNNELDDKLLDKRLSNDDKLNKRLKTYFDFDKDKFTWETSIYKHGNNITANFNIRDHTNNRVIYIQYTNDYDGWHKVIKLRMLSPQHIKNNFPELYQDKYVKSYRKIVNKIKRDFKESFLSVEDSAGQFKTFFIPIK